MLLKRSLLNCSEKFYSHSSEGFSEGNFDLSPCFAMNSKSDSHANYKPADWAALDALVLQGLSGLDELMVHQTENLGSPKQEKSLQVGGEIALERANGSDSQSFRTAREMRAAQERFAAQRRSVARRREQTQGVGFEPSITNQVAADSEQVFRSVAKPAFCKPPSGKARPVVPLPYHTKPEAPQSEAALIVKNPALPQERSYDRRTVAVNLPELDQKEVTDDFASFDPKVTMPEASDRGREFQEKQTSHSKPSELERRGRLVDPKITREASKRPTKHAWATMILLSVLATTVLWGAVLLAFWKSFGADWMQNQFSNWFGSSSAYLTESVDRLETNVIDLQEEHVLLEARFEGNMQMEKLEDMIFSTNARQHFDELLALGKGIGPTLTSELGLFKERKTRIEQAYIRKVRLLKGLDAGQLFPTALTSKDSDLKSDTLLDFLSKLNEGEWSRARVAFVLRQFQDDDKVIAGLLQVIRDDSNLPVMFAAWDSLVTLTGYKAVNGFDPDHFHSWWRKGS